MEALRRSPLSSPMENAVGTRTDYLHLLGAGTSPPTFFSNEDNNGSKHEEDDDLESLPSGLEPLSSQNQREPLPLSPLQSTTTSTNDDFKEQASTQPAPEDFVEEERVSELTMKLLESCQKRDPVAKLNEFYQKKGIVSLKKSFRDISCRVGTRVFWRCELTCPESGEVYYSSIPRSLLLSKDKDPGRLIVKLGSIFGAYHVVDREFVSFASKKGAKKSAALSALECLKATDISYEGRLLFHSFIDASLASGVVIDTHATESPNPIAQEVESQEATAASSRVKKVRTKFPSWAMELNEMGVDSDSLSASFHQHIQTTENIQAGGWKVQEMKVYCRLVVGCSPLKQELSVNGEPKRSKLEAIESAVKLLREEMGRTKLCERQSTSAVDWRHVNHLFTSVNKEKNVSYICPMPCWANGSMSTPKSSQYKLFCLYELKVTDTNGTPLVTDRMGLNNRTNTRLGIMFAEDVASCHTVETHDSDSSPEFEAQFELPEQSSKLTVTLRNRVLVDLSDGVTGSDHDTRLTWMKSFNTTISKWKVYGLHKRVNTAGFIDEDGDEIVDVYDGSTLDRTYMFVPLCDGSNEYVSIDWTMLRRVSEERPQQYLLPVKSGLSFPFLGEMDFGFFGYTLALFALIVFAPELYLRVKAVITSNPSLFESQIEGWEFALGTLMAVGAFISFCCDLLIPPKILMSSSTLENRFLTQRQPARHELFIYRVSNTKEVGAPTSLSLLLSQEKAASLDNVVRERTKEKFHLDLRKATFREFYLKKYGVEIRYPSLKLLPVTAVRKHTDYDPISRGPNRSNGEENYAIPELVYALPMPRDVLYVCNLADKFMPALERAICIRSFADSLDQKYNIYSRQPDPSCHSRTSSVATSKLLPSLLDDATTIIPCKTYERLEHLGDAVLSYYIALNLIGRNSTLLWDWEELSSIHSTAAKNKALLDASFRIGASQLIQMGRWEYKTAYKNNTTTANNPGGSLQAEQQQILADKHVGDVVESLLAVAYLSGRCDNSKKGQDLVVALLEELQLPLPPIDEPRSEERWFQVANQHTCFDSGFPFELDKAWQSQVIELQDILKNHDEIAEKLNAGMEKLMAILKQESINDATPQLKVLQTPIPKLLIQCALFDDNINDDDDDDNSSSSVVCSGSEAMMMMMENDLIRLGLLRDSLFHMGHYALQLYITDKAYHRYPTATAGDLNLIKACSINDDVLVYVMFKTGIHECLFDDESEDLVNFKYKLIVAESMGVWERNKNANDDGWILGMDEFHKRCGQQQERLPRYVGLAGGRLYGTDGRKLPKHETENLKFSMKCIIGALLLSLGMEGLVNCLLEPLFTEVMLLTPDELRSEFQEQVSTICCEQRGHDASLPVPS